MITIEPNKLITIQDASGQQFRVVQAMRAVYKDSTVVYDIARTHKDAPVAKMLSVDYFQSLITGLDPAKSLPVVLNKLVLPAVSLAQRLTEPYHIVPGIPELTVEPYHPQDSGFQHKIEVFGQTLQNVSEVLVSAGGAVTVANTIASLGSIAAFKMPAATALTILGANSQLGIVSLVDGANPIVDGEVVEISYETVAYTAYEIKDEADAKVKAIVANVDLVNYLLANQ